LRLRCVGSRTSECARLPLLRAPRPRRAGRRGGAIRPRSVDPLGRCRTCCYDSRAVLGGELAVPCTCNPLQQG